MRKAVIWILIFLALAFCSCSTRPDWTKSGYYEDLTFRGGPCELKADAMNEAYVQVSAYLETKVSSMTIHEVSSFNEEVNSEMRREYEDFFHSLSESSTETVFSGLRVRDQYFNPYTKQWYVLVEMNEEKLEASILATAEEVKKKSVLIAESSPKAAAFAQNVLSALPSLSISDRIQQLSSALDTLGTYPYHSSLTGKLDGIEQNIESCLEARLSEALLQLTISSDQGKQVLVSNRINDVGFTVKTADGSDPGILQWVVYSSDNARVGEFITQGKSGIWKVSPDVMIKEEQAYSVNMKGRNASSPETVLVFQYVKEALSVVLDISDESFRVSLSQYLSSLLSGENLVYGDCKAPSLIISSAQRVKEASQFQTWVVTDLEVVYQPDELTSMIWSASAESAGRTEAEARENSYKKMIDELKKSKGLSQFLSKNIKKIAASSSSGV